MKELSKAYDPAEVEGRWYSFWKAHGYFTAAPTSEKPPFSIVLPPPNVTGSLHLGHALTATLQDILSRWKRMSGFNVLWLPGTDHAGIATQMVVEKELRQTEKKNRHDLGREAFLQRVWAWKDKFGQRIGLQHEQLGASLDWTRERFTMDSGLSKAVKEVFVRLYEEGLIYRAQKLINWCPSCNTALSDLEVEHEERNGSLWHLRYPVEGEGRYLVVATTRPETMLGDTAVAIHPDDERYKDLHGKFVVLPLVGRRLPIITDAELVNPEFGTGVVKVTPAHDPNDYQTGLRHKLEMISILDEKARTTAEAGAYAGLDRYDARKRVLADLTEQGLLEKEEPHKLSVGTCQRCETVVEPRLSPQWFVKIAPLAAPAIEAVEQGKTKFVPESWTQTYFHWMRNIHDWCISRQLWWGHQIPAYYCRHCSPHSKENPIVARETPAACPSCGGHEFEQDPDVLDTWFSSGLWPFSTLGWPENTEELRTFYPTSVMETGHDIIFFWVARMMMMGIHFMKDVPFRTVYLHAMVRDEKGEKMSKTKGNVIDPLDLISGAPPEKLLPTMRNKYPEGMPAFGADALRFTLASLTQQGRDIKLSLDRVGGYKAFANKLWNASRFLQMNLGDETPAPLDVNKAALTLADRWILSRLNRATAETTMALESFAFAEAASVIYQFLWREFCDWYIELTKSSLYGEDLEAKKTTRTVLVFVLEQILRLLHPFMPFVTEEIWQALPKVDATASIMIAAYPKHDSRLEDVDAEREMEPVIAAIEGVRNIRGESSLPPSAKLEAHIQTSESDTRVTLDKWRSYVMPLAGLSAMHLSAPGPKPAMAAAYVGPQMEIYVPLAGVIDLQEERARLTKEIARSEADLAPLRRKLDNPAFVEKAPPAVVEKDRARVEELETRRAKLKESLQRISPERGAPEETQKNGKNGHHAEAESPPLPPGGDKTSPPSAAGVGRPVRKTTKKKGTARPAILRKMPEPPKAASSSKSPRKKSPAKRATPAKGKVRPSTGKKTKPRASASKTKVRATSRKGASKSRTAARTPARSQTRASARKSSQKVRR